MDGLAEGIKVGLKLGGMEDFSEGYADGMLVGLNDGFLEGVELGLLEEWLDGIDDGRVKGEEERAIVGTALLVGEVVGGNVRCRVKKNIRSFSPSWYSGVSAWEVASSNSLSLLLLFCSMPNKVPSDVSAAAVMKRPPQMAMTLAAGRIGQRCIFQPLN